MTERLLADPEFRAALEDAVGRAVERMPPASRPGAATMTDEEALPSSVVVEPA